MPQPMRIVLKDGVKWCPVPDAARYLKTNAPVIRKLMGEGKLTYAQMRKNGPIYVSLSDVVKVQNERLYGASARDVGPTTSK